MENEYLKIEKEVLNALKFSNSEIRTYLTEKNIAGMKAFWRQYDQCDLKMLSDIVVQYEEYEICQIVKELLFEKDRPQA